MGLWNIIKQGVSNISSAASWCQGLLTFTKMSRSLKKFGSLFLVGISLSVAIAACGGNPNADGGSASSAGATEGDKELTLVSYAVTRAAYEKIIPQFTNKWKQEHNQNVTFSQSYGGSGSQTRAVVDGLEADVVALALALDIKKIEQAGLIEPGWEKEAPNDSILTKSVAAVGSRAGDGRGI